jgi:hypothetical protein
MTTRVRVPLFKDVNIPTLSQQLHLQRNPQAYGAPAYDGDRAAGLDQGSIDEVNVSAFFKCKKTSLAICCRENGVEGGVVVAMAIARGKTLAVCRQVTSLLDVQLDRGY